MSEELLNELRRASFWEEICRSKETEALVFEEQNLDLKLEDSNQGPKGPKPR